MKNTHAMAAQLFVQPNQMQRRLPVIAETLTGIKSKWPEAFTETMQLRGWKIAGVNGSTKNIDFDAMLHESIYTFLRQSECKDGRVYQFKEICEKNWKLFWDQTQFTEADWERFGIPLSPLETLTLPGQLRLDHLAMYRRGGSILCSTEAMQQRKPTSEKKENRCEYR